MWRLAQNVEDTSTWGGPVLSRGERGDVVKGCPVVGGLCFVVLHWNISITKRDKDKPLVPCKSSCQCRSVDIYIHTRKTRGQDVVAEAHRCRGVFV